ncbi:MAG: cytochrome C [Gammaproteobacteria bacterium]|nr:cytochrome C [Gammaproteobacteria bacterium]
MLIAKDTLETAGNDDLLLGDDGGEASGELLDGNAGGDDLLSESDSEDAGGDDLLSEGDSEDVGGDDLLSEGESEDAGGDDLLSEDEPEDSSGDDLLSEESLDEDSEDVLSEATDSDDDDESSRAESAKAGAAADHAALFLENRFPAATTCRTCHPRHFDEWAISQHAYAQLSPVFNTMQGAVLALTNGTNGDFCIRCHTPVGMNLGEPLFMSNLDRHPTSREGITCITCHRVNQDYGKISGRLPIIEGDITQPVFGPSGNKNLKKALADPKIRVTTDPEGRGRKIHSAAEQYSYLSQPGFCGTCHDVTLVNGFRLEEAFSEYKMSPSARRGETCQDCHMSTVPGVASGYAFGPAAQVGGVETPARKLTNHRFVGPDHSVIHPGLFPLNEDGMRMASMAEWLQFDYKAGWGTDEFEEKVSDDHLFPERWSSVDDRFDARAIIEVQLERLDEMSALRKQLLQSAYRMGRIEVDEADSGGLRFRVVVSSGTDGHNVPTGFTGERLVFLQVTVTDNAGNVIFRSGDLDPNGDLRDLHSLYVHNGELPRDSQLFNLQSNFITRNIRGGEREQVLAINFSPDPLPFLRPDTRPTILTGRTLGARIHKKGIEPLGQRTARYRVSGSHLSGATPYTINVKLIAGMIPVNLIAAIQGVGFDYGMSPRAIADAVLAGHQVLTEQETVVDLE